MFYEPFFDSFIVHFLKYHSYGLVFWSNLQFAGTSSLNRLKCTSNLEDLRTSDVIIEAIVESEVVKKKLFLELDKIVKESTILASNTSSISITRLASSTSRPSKVLANAYLLQRQIG